MPAPSEGAGRAHARRERRELDVRDAARHLGAPHHPSAGDERGRRRPGGDAAVASPREHCADAGHPAAGRHVCAHRPGQSGAAADADARGQPAHPATDRCPHPALAAGNGRAAGHSDLEHRYRPTRGAQQRNADHRGHRATAVRAALGTDADAHGQLGAARGLCDVHLRFDRNAQGRGHSAPRHRPAGVPPVLRTAQCAAGDAACGPARLRCLDPRNLGAAAQWRHLRDPPAGHPHGHGAGRHHPRRGRQCGLADGGTLQPRRGREPAASAGAAHADDGRRGPVATPRAQDTAGAARAAADQRLWPHGDHYLRRDRPGVGTRPGHAQFGTAGPSDQLDLRAGAHPRRRTGTAGADRRTLHRRPRPCPGLPEPPGPDPRALRARPVRSGERHALPHRRCRALAGRWPARVSGPAGRAAQDPRFPDRTGRDRGRAVRTSGRGQRRHHGRDAPQWRAPSGGLAGGGSGPDTAR